MTLQKKSKITQSRQHGSNGGTIDKLPTTKRLCLQKNHAGGTAVILDFFFFFFFLRVQRPDHTFIDNDLNICMKM